MKYPFLALPFLAASAHAAVVISEFQPNPVGGDPVLAPFEISGGVPLAAFDYWILSIESDGFNGLIDRASNVTGSFDANGLAVLSIGDLENPSFTVALVTGFTGSVGDDLDALNDGVVDLSAGGITGLVDAIGVPDNVGDATVTAAYAAALGGTSFAYTGDEPGLVFRDGTTGDWYALNEPFDGTTVYDISAGTVSAAGFDSTPALAGTFGAVNPSFIPEPTTSLLGAIALLGLGLRRRR